MGFCITCDMKSQTWWQDPRLIGQGQVPTLWVGKGPRWHDEWANFPSKAKVSTLPRFQALWEEQVCRALTLAAHWSTLELWACSEAWGRASEGKGPPGNAEQGIAAGLLPAPLSGYEKTPWSFLGPSSSPPRRPPTPS